MGEIFFIFVGFIIDLLLVKGLLVFLKNDCIYVGVVIYDWLFVIGGDEIECKCVEFIFWEELRVNEVSILCIFFI